MDRDMAVLMMSYERGQRAMETRLDVAGQFVSALAAQLSRLEAGQ